MKKIAWYVLLVLALSAVCAVPILAEAGPARRWRGTLFSLVGTVKGVGAESVTVLVQRGTRPVRDYIGAEEGLTILITDRTRIREYGAPPGEFITLEEVAAGDNVSVRGYVSTDQGTTSFYADRVTVGILLECLQCPGCCQEA